MSFWEVLCLVLYSSIIAVLGVYGLHRYQLLRLFYRHHPTPVPQPDRFAELPFVTIQLPLYNEYHVVERLLEAVGQIDYPRDRLQIQVLDDSQDETRDKAREGVARLAAQGLDIDYLGRTNRHGFKAGALAAGLERAQGEFVLVLDADFVPTPDILQRAIHYFTDNSIGMVQMRWGHLNRSYSLLTRIQSIFLDGHFVVEHTARNRSGRFFNFNGTGGIWRKKAIYDAGGWQHDTLTEDLDLSYRAQLAGWQFLYLPEIEVPGEIPVEINAFKSQQHRWTKGAVPDGQESTAADLALCATSQGQGRGHLSSDGQPLLYYDVIDGPIDRSSAFHSLATRLGAVFYYRPAAVFFCHHGHFRLLHYLPARALSRLATTDQVLAHADGHWHESLHQQHPSGDRGSRRLSNRFSPHSQIRAYRTSSRPASASGPQAQVPKPLAAAVFGRIGHGALFRLCPLPRLCDWPLLGDALPAAVPRWLSLHRFALQRPALVTPGAIERKKPPATGGLGAFARLNAVWITGATPAENPAIYGDPTRRSCRCGVAW